MGIIIRDLSTHGLFQNDMILAAGFGGLSREISYVSVIDTPLVPKPSYRLEDGVLSCHLSFSTTTTLSSF